MVDGIFNFKKYFYLNNIFFISYLFLKFNTLFFIYPFKIKYFLKKVFELDIIYKIKNFLKKIKILFFNYKIFFIRVSKIFNKGRYSRNRQNYRTGLYWCLYINIIIILSLYLYFYRFIFSFTYFWLPSFIFFISFFIVKFIKYNNNFNILKFFKSILYFFKKKYKIFFLKINDLLEDYINDLIVFINLTKL